MSSPSGPSTASECHTCPGLRDPEPDLRLWSGLIEDGVGAVLMGCQDLPQKQPALQTCGMMACVLS